MSDPVKPWCHLHVQTWPLIVEQLQRAGGEWAPEIVDQDLVWHEDQIRRGYLARLPSRRELATRWGWGDRKTRNRLQQLGEGWGVPTGSQQGPNRVPTGSQRKPEERQQSATKVPTGSQQGPTEVPTGSTRALVPETRDQRPETREHTPPPPAGGGVRVGPVEDPAVVAALPPWIRDADAPPGTDRLGLHGAVCRAIEAIRGELGRAHATDARAVLDLWRALDHPDPAALAADLELVADAARGSPDLLFSRHVRGVGWAGKRDSSRSVKALCAPAAWADRLEAAEAWRRAGRPGPRSAFAPQAPEPDDPAPETLSMHATGGGGWTLLASGEPVDGMEDLSAEDARSVLDACAWIPPPHRARLLAQLPAPTALEAS